MDRSSANQQPSLRSRYLLVSATITLILLAGTLTTSFYVKRITGSRAEALQLRDSVTEIIGQVRTALWSVNVSLDRLLISPSPEDRQAIHDYLDEASQQLERLWQIAALSEADLQRPAAALRRDLGSLRHDLLELMQLSQDPDWVYPMLPYINHVLLESNTEFETAATLALQEIASDDGNSYASDLYRRVAQIRDLWRRQILDFRAVLIRFAGLNRIERIAQEQNIDLLHTEIVGRLAGLEKLAASGRLGMETEEALPVMQYRAEKWYQDFQDLKKLREANVWRADAHYIAEFIQPKQLAVENDLTAIEQALLAWSSHNTARVEAAASQINLELWGFTVIALCFVGVVYYMLSRSVLGPIARIAETFTDGKRQTESLLLPARGSREISTLVSAFNGMRRQIRHRQLALEHQALHDALTGLPNRALLHDRLQQAVQLAQRHATQSALFLLDLDRFKEINDTLGHSVGDQALQIVAQRLQASLRKTDTVARLGGDEFAIACPDIDGEQLNRLLAKIVDQTTQAICLDNKNLYVGASIGIALCPDHGENADTLIRHADIAMYSAKRGHQDYAFFTPSMVRMDVDNLSLLGDLRQELRAPSGQFELHYQPQIRLVDRRPLGAEALLRWQHPQQGAVPPEQVIQMAEHAGLIAELTTWVLTQAIRDAADWQRAQLSLQLSVNLSAWNLQDPHLPAQVQRLLTDNGLAANRLTLEITESAVMEDPAHARQVLVALNAMGVNLSIDDYGTGLSSLAYLKMLPVNELKIDKSFVIDMLESEDDAIIVRSTIDLAHNLRLRVIAEGVEQAEGLECLQLSGCDGAQGYHIAQPMALAALRAWYNTHSAG